MKEVIARSVQHGIDTTPAVLVLSPGQYHHRVVRCTRIHPLGTWYQVKVQTPNTADQTNTSALTYQPESLVVITEHQALLLLSDHYAQIGEAFNPLAVLNPYKTIANNYALDADAHQKHRPTLQTPPSSKLNPRMRINREKRR